MKKYLVVIGIFASSSLFALTATQAMPAMYDKNDVYPRSGQEAVNMIRHGRACFIDKGQKVRRLDSSFSMLKVRTLDSSCAGWAPKEFFK